MNIRPGKTEEIVTCSICNGKGWTSHDTLECYHRGEYSTEYRACTTCEGSGLIKVVTEVKIERSPYKPYVPGV